MFSCFPQFRATRQFKAGHFYYQTNLKTVFCFRSPTPCFALGFRLHRVYFSCSQLSFRSSTCRVGVAGAKVNFVGRESKTLRRRGQRRPRRGRLTALSLSPRVTLYRACRLNSRHELLQCFITNHHVIVTLISTISSIHCSTLLSGK